MEIQILQTFLKQNLIFFKICKIKSSEKTLINILPLNSVFLYWNIVTYRKDSASNKEAIQLCIYTLNVLNGLG